VAGTGAALVARTGAALVAGRRQVAGPGLRELSEHLGPDRGCCSDCSQGVIAIGTAGRWGADVFRFFSFRSKLDVSGRASYLASHGTA